MNEEFEKNENIAVDNNGSNPGITETVDMEEKKIQTKEILPCIPLRGVSIFPNTVVHFDIGREKSIKALEAAMGTDKLMFVSTQKDENILIDPAVYRRRGNDDCQR